MSRRASPHDGFLFQCDKQLTAFLKWPACSCVACDFILQAAEIFGNPYGNQGLNPGKSASSDSSFPLSDLQSQN
jgi:hypothetical protein